MSPVNPTERFEQVLADYFEQVDSGVVVDAHELIDSNPELADELKDFFTDLGVINTLIDQATTDPVDHETTQEVPDRIDRYEVQTLLGEGGFGRVFLAFDEQLQRHVAIKVPHAHRMQRPEQRERFIAEGRSLARLRHPGLLAVFDAGEDDNGLCYTVTEYIEGESLAEKMAEEKLPVEKAIDLGIQIAEGLHAAHTAGIVHRDLKPANVLVDQAGRACIADFGLALETNVDLETSQEGTPSYMPPEAIQSRHLTTDARGDIWSFGVVLYEMVCGQRPFRRNDRGGLFQSIVSTTPQHPRTVNPKASQELSAIIERCLVKAPSGRFATAAEAARAMRRIATTKRRRQLSKMLLILGLFTAALAFFGNRVWRDRSSSQTVEQIVSVEPTTVVSTTNAAIARPLVLDKLNRRLQEEEVDPSSATERPGQHGAERFNLKLARAAINPSTLDSLLEELPSATPTEIQATREFLQQLTVTSPDIADRFHQTVTTKLANAQTGRAAKLRLCSLLGKRLQNVPAIELVQALLEEPLINIDDWAVALRPFSPQLTSLAEVLTEDHPEPLRRKALRTFLLLFHQDVEALANVFQYLRADEIREAVHPLVGSTIENRLLQQLQAVCAQKTATPDTEDWSRYRIAEANAILILAKNGEPHHLWLALTRATFPDLRSHLIVRAEQVGVPFDVLVERLNVESDAGAITGILKAMTYYSEVERIDATQLSFIVSLFREHPDAGVHSAADRVLCLANQAIELPANTPESAMAKGRFWFTDQFGQTFAIVQPGTFTFGSPETERGRWEMWEQQVEVTIPRHLAVCTTEVTHSLYREIMGEASLKASEDDDLPVNTITHQQALAFCLELSKRSEISASEYCVQMQGTELVPLDDCLTRTAYRLLTEAEFEYCCRAGTQSIRNFGYSDELLDDYVWYKDNSTQIVPATNRRWAKLHPVATRHPNEFGIHDMLGNAFEWCFTSYDDMLRPESPPVDPIDAILRVSDLPAIEKWNVMRLGAAATTKIGIRSAGRNTMSGNFGFGFRVCRTLIPAD